MRHKEVIYLISSTQSQDDMGNVINEESLNAQIRDFLTGALKVDVLPPEDSEDAEKEEEADES